MCIICISRLIVVLMFSSLQYLKSISKITNDELVEFFNELTEEDPDGTTLPVAVLFYSERLIQNKNARSGVWPIFDRLVTNRFGGETRLVSKLIS